MALVYLSLPGTIVSPSYIYRIQMTSETHFHSECFVANVAPVGVATSDFGWNKICVTANWDHTYIMSAE